MIRGNKKMNHNALRLDSRAKHYPLVDIEPMGYEIMSPSLTGPGHQRNCCGRWMGIANICFFGFSLFLLLLSVAVNTRNRDHWALEETSFYSPMFDRYRVKFVRRTAAGSLFDEAEPSEQDLLLRSYPSAEVDAAWKALTDVSVVTITSKEVVRLGKDPQKTVRAPLEWGFGPDAHLAQIDGQNALNCLNTVRQYAYREHYFRHLNESSGGRSPFETADRARLSHCLHVLLQALTCSPSMDMITHNWVGTQLFPQPDLDINKKCVDHTQLLDWQEQHRLSEDQWRSISFIGPAAGEHVHASPMQLQKRA